MRPDREVYVYATGEVHHDPAMADICEAVLAMAAKGVDPTPTALSLAQAQGFGKPCSFCAKERTRRRRQRFVSWDDDLT